MKLLGYLVLPLTMICLLAIMAGDADARRFGGGRSFGSKPSFSKSYQKPTTATSTQSKAAGANKQSGFARPGMGLMGGLLAGTFLGSMLGGGMGGGGGGFFNILIIGLLIYLGFKFFKSRNGGSSSLFGQNKSQQQQAPPRQTNDNDLFARREQNSQNAWDHLSSKPASAPSAAPVDTEQDSPEIGVPAGFDSEDFLEGAKAIYTRLQASWDKRDIADIEQFANKTVVDEIKQQAAEDPTPSKTDIMLINARLLEVKEEGSNILATVYYDVLLREEANQSQPSQVREVWNFVKENNDSAMWKLDGLQQLED
ncbi:Tim44 domain-containing protein [Maridesulfovibrio ferrireducens]|uniref:Tim44 domain-containing protein n=1 Tax=Maridesulfovibrio ferrireducens TaxID=246191 RepID=UPI001A26ACB0|nr:TIM44-like domain-containing protein [Maridesulfovibrio ferrireducens]MBI9110371.1 Tim44 domain-containing protein [Maridesulfovibrio ferrireducens]